MPGGSEESDCRLIDNRWRLSGVERPLKGDKSRLSLRCYGSAAALIGPGGGGKDGGGGGRASLPGGWQMCDPGAVAPQARATADSQLEARGKPRWCIQPARSCRRDSRVELIQSPPRKHIQLARSEKDASAVRTSAEGTSPLQPAARLTERHREARPLTGRSLVKSPAGFTRT